MTSNPLKRLISPSEDLCFLSRLFWFYSLWYSDLLLHAALLINLGHEPISSRLSSLLIFIFNDSFHFSVSSDSFSLSLVEQFANSLVHINLLCDLIQSTFIIWDWKTNLNTAFSSLNSRSQIFHRTKFLDNAF